MKVTMKFLIVSLRLEQFGGHVGLETQYKRAKNILPFFNAFWNKGKVEVDVKSRL